MIKNAEYMNILKGRSCRTFSVGLMTQCYK